jgi:hypothetical protein
VLGDSNNDGGGNGTSEDCGTVVYMVRQHEKKHGKKCGVAKKLHFSQGLLGSVKKKEKSKDWTKPW